jgi:glutamyl-tRNA reductase
MRLSLIGINHQTAPLAIREKAATSSDRLPGSLSLLCSHVPQGVIVSTCNRTEIYTITSGEGDDTKKAVLAFLRVMLGVPDTELLNYVYAYRDTEAARHLFRVTSGLESMVVGEYEVLGQVRQALEAAERAGTVNLPLRYTFQSAIRTGRLVREQTGISRNALSVSSIAVDLAADIIGDLKKCRMLVIGAGDAGRLVARVARERGASQIVIASRTRDRAQALASVLNGVPADLSRLDDELSRVDIVVTCAGAPHRILGSQRIEKVMRNRPEVPMVIIDIALPRNVEPDVGNLRNVFLFNIDDLTGIADLNRKQREDEIQRAERIIANEVEKFDRYWHELETRPIVGALMSRADEIRLAQLNKTLKRLPPLSEEQRENLEAMTKSIVARILKDPVRYLRANGNDRRTELVKELFNLKAERPQ